MSDVTRNTMRLERNQWLLWALTLLLVFALSLTVYALSLRMSADIRESMDPAVWLHSGYSTGICLVGLICIFILYTILQQIELRNLRRRYLGEEQELEELRSRLGEITHLFEAATELNLRLPVDSILSIMVRRVVSALKAQQASVMLFNPVTGMLETKAYYGVEGEFTASGRVRLGEGIAGKVAELKQAMLLDDGLQNTEITQHYRPYRNISSALSIPLVVGDQCVGVMNVNRINNPRHFNDQQKEIVRLFAQNIGAVIQSAEDLEKVKGANRQLLSENDRLLEMNRLKDIFLSTASHELKTPLTSVIGYAELLNDHDQDLGLEQRQEFTRRLRVEAGQLLSLIEDILDLTRLETGKIELKRTRVNLNDLTRTAVETVRALAQKHEIGIVEDYEQTEDCIPLDEVKIRQAVVNLCVNAIKFSPAKSEIRIRTLFVENAALVEITDHGPGVSAEESAQIFTLFGQGHRPTAKGTGGVGIGLHLVKRIVELHGGSVGLKSQPGSGSTFWVRLPMETPGTRVKAA